jgi:hypothetical protein
MCTLGLGWVKMLWTRLKIRRTAITDREAPSFFLTVHDNPVSFLQAVGPHLRSREELANTILPFAEAAAVDTSTSAAGTIAISPATGEGGRLTGARSVGHGNIDSKESVRPIYDQFYWITCWSRSASLIMSNRDGNTSDDNNGNAEIGTPSQVDYVAMHGTSSSGPTPVFLVIANPRPSRNQGNGHPDGDEFSMAALRAMAAKLGDLVEPHNVCSVFGPMPFADIFSGAWQALIGGSLPLQAIVRRRSRMMCFAKARAESQARDREHTLHSGQKNQADVAGIRLATVQDAGRVAQLCQLFALTMVS